MKILCDRQQLQEAFAVVSGIAPQKTPKPIIQNVLLRAEGESVVLFATDLEMSARVTLNSVKVEEPGAVLLPARETSALLRELDEATLTLVSKELRCTIDGSSGSFVLLGDDPALFPAESSMEGRQMVSLPAGRLVEMVRRTGFAAAREETRYAINGVLIDLSGGAVKLVATDGRRLALTYQNLDAEHEDVRAVVPNRALQALTRAVPEDGTENVQISISPNQIGFKVGEVTLVSQLLENRFPEYEQVIPKVADTTIEVDRSLLEQNLRKVAILSSGDVRMVRFEFSPSGLQLSAESSGVGRADLTMDADVKGSGGSISFNPDYLMDALKACDLEVVRIDMTDDTTPAKFTLGEAYTYVLMPISGS